MPAAERWCGEAVVLVSSKCWRRLSVMKAEANGQMSTVQLRIVLIYGIKQSLPWEDLWVEWERVLLSALHVLLPLYVWVNPAFYQWHHSAFTKRISELEWTGQALQRERNIFYSVTFICLGGPQLKPNTYSKHSISFYAFAQASQKMLVSGAELSKTGAEQNESAFKNKLQCNHSAS